MKKKIYLADDESNIRNLFKAFLLNDGYDVTAFDNGEHLIMAFEDEPADLLILDVMMPGANGFAVCREIRKKSTVPIIMVTARDTDLDMATGRDLGCDDYLIKPFSPTALLNRVDALFRCI
jgi:DNA-binding response OmpR family regulator